MRRYFVLVSLTCFLAFHIDVSGQSLFETSLNAADTTRGGSIILGGFIRSAAYFSFDREESKVCIQSLYSQFGLSALAEAGKFGNAFAEVRYRTGNEFGEKINQVELREAYVNLFLGPVAIKAGKQIFSWGSTAFINPSDQFSPVNPVIRSPESGDLRIGTWALETNFLINTSSSLHFVWLPFHVSSVLLTEPFNFPEYIDLNSSHLSQGPLNRSSFGIKYDLRTSVLDLDLSYYNGYRNTPSISLDTAIFNFTTFQPERISLLERSCRIHSTGLNLTVPIGSYLFRSEIAWMDFTGEQDAGTKLPLPELTYAFEVEQSGANVTFIAGYYGKYILDFVDGDFTPALLTDGFPDPATIFPPGSIPEFQDVTGYVDQQVEGFNRLYNYQQKEFYHSAYLSLTVSMLHNMIELDVPGMYNFTAAEFTLMPALKFNISDNFSFTMGSYSLFGKENSLYDMAGPVLNAAYGMLQLKF